MTPMTIARRIRKKDEGFTLVELMVVVMIIAILMAIAIPTFLNSRKRAQDSAAKSDARNLVSHMESCFTVDETYTGCETSDDVLDSGLPLGTADGEVQVSGGTDDGYTITAYSESGTDFTYVKDTTANPIVDKNCTALGEGGCPSDGNW